jgi:hypothetical protein
MVIPFMLLIAVLALGFVVATGWALARWPGRGRWLAGAPLLFVSAVGLRSIVESSVDPMPHSLWPLEVLGVMVLVGVALGGLQLGGVIVARSSRAEKS